MLTITPVLQLLVFALIIGNVLALFAGLSLLVAPKRIAKWLGLRAAHPLSIRLLTRPFERPRDSGKVMLRYPRLLGAILLVGGAFVLVRWISFLLTVTVADGARLLMRLFAGAALPQPVWESFWIVTLALILLGAALAILVGGLALVRVQTLKSLSHVTDRWISTRRAAKPASRPYYGIDRLVGENPQVWGGIITLLSIYTLVMIVWSVRAPTL